MRTTFPLGQKPPDWECSHSTRRSFYSRCFLFFKWKKEKIVWRRKNFLYYTDTRFYSPVSEISWNFM